jgi:aspartate-semialdehyde dehydrogenase
MKKKTGLKVAVVGATGAVGKEMVDLLESRSFPFSELHFFASSRSLGKVIECGGKKWMCKVLEKGCFDGIDVAFFDASDEVSKQWVPEARKAGVTVIDSSGTYRMADGIPLVVPEVNGQEAVKAAASAKGDEGALIAGPNCTTVQLVVALKPLHDKYGLKRVVVSTYQSVSGAGASAMEELRTQTGDVLAGKPAKAVQLKHPIAFNCIPQIGGFVADGEFEGQTSEEKKVIVETRKILGLPQLKVACTAIRVPTFTCHAESVLCEFERRPEPKEALETLAKFPGVEVVDEPKESRYPMHLTGAKRDAVYVGRLRRDPSSENGLQFWVVSDNLRKGAALNAIQVAETLLRS